MGVLGIRAELGTCLPRRPPNAARDGGRRLTCSSLGAHRTTCAGTTSARSTTPSLAGSTTPRRVGPVDVLALARRALAGPSRAIRDLPRVSASHALELSHLTHLYLASFDSEGFSFHQKLRHFAMCRLEDPAQRLARHVHRLSNLFLVEPFEVGEAESLKLVEPEAQHFPRRSRRASPAGPEASLFRREPYPSASLWSWHWWITLSHLL